MKTLIRTEVFIIGLALLSACATSNISTSYQMGTNPHEGLLIGSVTTSANDSVQTGGVQYIFRRVDNDESGMIFAEARGTMGRALMGENRKDIPGESGHLFVLRLKSGQYHFTQWLIQNGPYVVLSPRVSPNAKFSIEAGKATYVGNIHMKIVPGIGTINKLFIENAIPVVRDRRERDIPLIIAGFPAVTEDNVRYEILDNQQFNGHKGIETDVYIPPLGSYK
jgi:hypothetical protein